MIGFILSAGFGKRLMPITEHIPKALVPVCGMSMLERTIDSMGKAGIESFGINVHHIPEPIYDFRDKSGKYFEIFHEKGEIRGTGGALFFAQEFLSRQEAFCVCNVDIFTQVDLGELSEEFVRSDCICALAAVRPTASDIGTILYERNSNEYIGTPGSGQKSHSAVEDADFIGIAFYRREIFDYLSEDDFGIIPVWARLKGLGESVKVLVSQNTAWYDIGTPGSFSKIHFDCLDRRIEIPVPEGIVVDRESKMAYPEMMREKSAKLPWSYVWTYSGDMGPLVKMDRCIVLEGADLSGKSEYSNSILTPWGEVNIE